MLFDFARWQINYSNELYTAANGFLRDSVGCLNSGVYVLAFASVNNNVTGAVLQDELDPYGCSISVNPQVFCGTLPFGGSVLCSHRR